MASGLEPPVVEQELAPMQITRQPGEGLLGAMGRTISEATRRMHALRGRRPGEQTYGLLDVMAREGLGQAPSIFDVTQALRGPTGEDIRLADLAYQPSSAAVLGAVQQAGGMAAQRGLTRGSTRAALTGMALSPLVGAAQQGRARALMELPFLRARALGAIRGQAFGEGMGAFEAGLGLRGMRLQERQFAEQLRKSREGGGFFKRLGGALLGGFGGAFLGPLGAALGSKAGGSIFGGGGGGGGGMGGGYGDGYYANEWAAG